MTVHTTQLKITEHRIDGTGKTYDTWVYSDRLKEIATRFLCYGYEQVEDITFKGLIAIETPVGYNIEGLIEINLDTPLNFSFNACYMNTICFNADTLIGITISYRV